MKKICINLTFLAFLWIFHISQATASDFDVIKKRVLTNLLEQNIHDKAVETMVKTINPDGTWPDINYEDVSNEGFQRAITLAFKNWVDHDYICKKWWHNEVGTPTNLVNLMLLVGDELPKELVEKGTNFWTVWNEDDQATHISIALPQDNYAGDGVTIQLNE